VTPFLTRTMAYLATVPHERITELVLNSQEAVFRAFPGLAATVLKAELEKVEEDILIPSEKEKTI
jgi:hypothetical protein